MIRTTILVLMSLYAIEKLIEQTRRVAAEFRSTTGTVLPVSAEIARYDVARLLGFDVMDKRDIGFDLVGSGRFDGMHVLVKSRLMKDQGGTGYRIGQLNMDADWDIVALSIMNEEFEPVEIYLADREILETEIGDSSRNKRGAMSVAKFVNIADMVWTAETGTLDEHTRVTACKQA